jgi:hypothetical protein
MPSNYAHYRFGMELIGRLNADQRRTVQRFRQLFDMGLHGPDLFYHHNPLFQTPARKLGDKYHAQTGKAFFERVCRSIRMNPSEGAMAYLYGVLAHFALDSLSHPYVCRMAESGSATHSEIETEFDRFLLETDGRKPPYLQDLSTHITLTPGECETVALFYPPVSSGTIRRCVKNMAANTRFLTMPKGIRRDLVSKAAALISPNAAGLVMTIHPNRKCAGTNKSLMRLYEMAMNRYPILLDQIESHFSRNAPLGTDFSVIFG